MRHYYWAGTVDREMDIVPDKEKPIKIGEDSQWI
jgi:hypothetical protein